MLKNGEKTQAHAVWHRACSAKRMKGFSRIRLCSALMCLALGTLSAPVFAFSAEDPDGDGFVLMPAQKRYYALPKAEGTPKPLRSDMDALKRGFMRIDRSAVNTVRRATSVRSQVSSVRTIRPTAVPDTTLLKQFEAEMDSPRVAGVVNHAWPLPAHVKQYVSSGYGMRKDPFHGRLAFHGGLDIAAAPGTAILASAAGTVKEVGRRGGYGNYVLLVHADGSESMYNHLERAEVRMGARVRSGETIGRLGSTGRSTGPHLDYRLKQAGKRIDPMLALAGKKPNGAQFAQNAASSRADKAYPEVRTQNGVRVVTPRLTPQERVAMGGGFIQVR
jgi:murein DD-endopeptidase MepM/ murein hydrolase activator NlpD